MVTTTMSENENEEEQERHVIVPTHDEINDRFAQQAAREAQAMKLEEEGRTPEEGELI
jgi:hypothetical protein